MKNITCMWKTFNFKKRVLWDMRVVLLVLKILNTCLFTDILSIRGFYILCLYTDFLLANCFAFKNLFYQYYFRNLGYIKKVSLHLYPCQEGIDAGRNISDGRSCRKSSNSSLDPMGSVWGKGCQKCTAMGRT